jgi:hypothetical protein
VKEPISTRDKSRPISAASFHLAFMVDEKTNIPAMTTTEAASAMTYRLRKN